MAFIHSYRMLVTETLSLVYHRNFVRTKESIIGAAYIYKSSRNLSRIPPILRSQALGLFKNPGFISNGPCPSSIQRGHPVGDCLHRPCKGNNAHLSINPHGRHNLMGTVLVLILQYNNLKTLSFVFLASPPGIDSEGRCKREGEAQEDCDT